MTVTCVEMKAAEERLFAAGKVTADELMQKAAAGCVEAICDHFSTPQEARIFVGKGNNGGDALVIGTLLQERGWKVDARFSHPAEAMTDLAKGKRFRFEADSVSAPTVLIDGLLGIGARGPLRGAIGDLAEELNATRGTTFAIDIPSGLNGDTGEAYEGAVVADVTLSIAQVKAGLIADPATSHVGRISTIPLPEIDFEAENGPLILAPETIRDWRPKRRFGWHKGNAGRVIVVAGSRGLTGAVHLATLGAIHGGAGLVTVLAKPACYEILATRLPAEVMVKPVDDYATALRELRADVLAVGPGLGPERDAALCELLWADERPIVIDADALNWLASSPPTTAPAGPRLLTPHPGEISRWGDFGGSRAEIVEAFLEQHPEVTLLFKGARTRIAEGPSGRCAINTTGHPGMACGGMGDVLTGLTAALIGQGCGAFEAGALGSWLIGRAAEKAIFGSDARISQESLGATEVAAHLGAAIAELG